jgi:dipeptidyl aminopeptidase/acylaminoacyl peptidase
MRDDWRDRFTAARIDQVAWGADAPDKVAVVSTEDGTAQAWSWDLGSGDRLRASTGGVGAEEAYVLPDGTGVLWWLDLLGDERGHWMVSPFGDGEATALLPELPDAWMMGISFAPDALAVGFSTDDDYVIYIRHGDDPPQEIYRNERPAGVGREFPQGAGGLSADGGLVCIRHAEQGDIMHQALRVIDTRTGIALADLIDPGCFLGPVAWSPFPGDQRLLIHHERDGMDRPGIWDIATGVRTDIALPHLSGPVTPLDWMPVGDRVLLRHETTTGEQELMAFDVADGSTEPMLRISGTIDGARARPDGDVWYRRHSGVDAPTIRNLAGDIVLSLPGRPAPSGHLFRPFDVLNPNGDRIAGYVVAPEGTAPFPTIVSVHGGPEWHHTNAWSPRTQAYVDNGFAVLLVNYRGSTGAGRAHREAISGNIGFPESDDIIAALDLLIAEGVADPARVAIEGWSWGGYLANLNAGINPDRWKAVIAGIPAGDYVAAHYESAPSLQAWDVSVMGGTPMELPELYAERNPMTYVDRVRAPTLIIAGTHDSRCPLGQVMVHAHALKVRGKTVEIHLYPGGHHANDAQESIRQVELILDFLHRHV